MNNEDFWIKVWNIVAVTLTVIVIASLWFNTIMNRDYIEGGYSKQMVVGYGEPVWMKQ